MEKKKYPIGAEGYELYEEVGHGVSAAVHRALCLSLNEIVAIKVLDFERDNCDLNNIMREAQTMILIDHPNVLKAHCSFVHKETLWVVMPYMAGGSCLHIMKSSFSNGLEETIIATILKEVLKALEYLHHHGHIHRDVKAGNILVDLKGGIKLGDFGVSACLFETGDRMRFRNTFVGTPCWMAPEVLEQKKGYDFKADIWSFGITALELAHGHAPFSKYPPMKVLLMTLQNPPPGLDYERDKNRFSKAFRQMIAMCLMKDPSKRPTAKKLLKHSFFKQAKSQDYINRKLLDGLPTLGDQYQALKEKEEALLAQKKMPDNEKEELSQNEYKRGISGWNFDLEDLKAQASLLPDNEDGVLSAKDSENCLFEIDTMQEKMSENLQEKALGNNGSVTPTCLHKTEEENNNTNSNNNSNTNISNNNSCTNCEEEKVKTTAIQQRGRFKVTSESVDLDKAAPNLSALQKSYSMQVMSRLPTFNTTPSALLPPNIPPLTIYAQLQTILQNNMLQRDHILSLMKQVSLGDLSPASVSSSNHSGELVSPHSSTTSSEKSLLEVAFDREKDYMQEITELQLRLMRMQEELSKLKEKVSNE